MQRDLRRLIGQRELDRAVVVRSRHLDGNDLRAAGGNIDLVGGQRERKIGPAWIADDDAIDIVAAAAAEQIFDGDLQLVHAGGNREIDQRIAAAGPVVAAGELLAVFLANGQHAVERRAKLPGDDVEPQLLLRRDRSRYLSSSPAAPRRR